MLKILYIHGINNEDNSVANIETTWTDALKAGLEKANGQLPQQYQVSAAFYGDRLKEETDSWGASKPPVSPMSTAAPQDDCVPAELADLYKEFQNKYGITDDQVAQELDPGDERDGVTPQAGGIHKKWLKAIARALEKVLPTKGKYIARIFLRQAAAYLQKPQLKETIDGIVKDQIFQSLNPEDEVIVISHSLGTIVSFDILRKLRNQVNVKLFMTLGSPLGIDMVKHRLGSPRIVPTGVGEWVNVYDKEDFVALKPILNEETFGTNEINNLPEVDNGYQDAHDILQYLTHEVVGEVILRHLQG